MSIGEFEEVGEVIRSFTSEDATVVVGTVIDTQMDDNLRVTVVLTGLNRGKERVFEKAKVRVAENTKNDGTINYEELEKPTVMRNQNKKDSVDEDHLDIPTFLNSNYNENK